MTEDERLKEFIYEHLPVRCQECSELECDTRIRYEEIIKTLYTGDRPNDELLSDEIIKKVFELTTELNELKEYIKKLNEGKNDS